ncbi:MAG: ABC transporter permease [Leucobacter sp.]
MVRVIVRRLLISLPLLVIVSFLTFALVSFTPGDAAYTVLGARATPEQLATVREEMGLDKPLLVQYLTWAGGVIQGDFGNSLLTGQPVVTAIGQRLGPTIALVLISALVSILIAVPLGVISAVRGGPLGGTIDAVSFAGLAIPNFIFALILIPVFAIWLQWLPPSGYVAPHRSLVEWALSLVLPVVALTSGAIGVIAKQTRSAVGDALGREFVAIQRANGFSSGSIVWRHVLRLAAVPILAMVGVMMVGLLSGTVLIETIFAVPGLGGLAVQASAQSDIPMVLGVTVVFTLFVIILNLVLDLCFVLVNPKVKLV